MQRYEAICGDVRQMCDGVRRYAAMCGDMQGFASYRLIDIRQNMVMCGNMRHEHEVIWGGVW